jgi:hypothetical protein
MPPNVKASQQRVTDGRSTAAHKKCRELDDERWILDIPTHPGDRQFHHLVIAEDKIGDESFSPRS